MKILVVCSFLALLCSESVCGQKRADSLFVFVGEKITINKLKPKLAENQILFDEAFEAKYKIVQRVYGTFKPDTINFDVYDHMGVPAFSKFDNVLLFVSNNNGKLYHEKYQFFDVYKTKAGKWASCGDPYKFDDYHRKDIKAVKLEFDQPISFDISTLSAERIKKWYPEPYFTLSNGQAFCVMGSYVDELFEVKKAGVLKARGIFE